MSVETKVDVERARELAALFDGVLRAAQTQPWINVQAIDLSIAQRQLKALANEVERLEKENAEILRPDTYSRRAVRGHLQGPAKELEAEVERLLRELLRQRRLREEGQFVGAASTRSVHRHNERLMQEIATKWEPLLKAAKDAYENGTGGTLADAIAACEEKSEAAKDG